MRYHSDLNPVINFGPISFNGPTKIQNITPNGNALDLLSSSDWDNDAKNGTPYSMNNNTAFLITKIQLI